METKRENENRERLRELTSKIATEQDPDKFMQLVKELNQVLGGDLRQVQDSTPEGNTTHNKPDV